MGMRDAAGWDMRNAGWGMHNTAGWGMRDAARHVATNTVAEDRSRPYRILWGGVHRYALLGLLILRAEPHGNGIGDRKHERHAH